MLCVVLVAGGCSGAGDETLSPASSPTSTPSGGSTASAATNPRVASSTSLIQIVSDLRLIPIEQPPLASPGQLPMLVSAAGTVFSDGTDVWMCAGQDDSYPPGCGVDVRLEGVSVADLPGAITAATDPSVGDAAWAEAIRVVGTYDGTTINVTEPPTRADFGPRSYDFSVPCPPLAWASGAAAGQAVAYAQRQHTYAGHWRASRRDTFVVAFTADLDEHRAALAEAAGAPLCIVGADYTRAELSEAQDAIGNDFRRWEEQGVAIRTVGSGELGNRVDVFAVWADESDREEFVRRYGDVVVLRSWITPLDTGSE